MDYLLPTDARIVIPERIRQFLKSDEPVFAIVGPVRTGRRTILKHVLSEAGVLDKAKWVASRTAEDFYQNLVDAQDAELVVAEDVEIAPPQTYDADWYSQAVRALAERDDLHRPRAADETLPETVCPRGKVIIVGEAEDSYHQVWQKVPGIAFAESALDVHNYIQRNHRSFITQHELEPHSLDAVLNYIRSMVEVCPEYLTRPTAGSQHRITDVIAAAREHASGDTMAISGSEEPSWQITLRQWCNGYRMEKLQQQATNTASRRSGFKTYDLASFQILDGMRGRLLLPKMIENFIEGEKQLFSFVVRYPLINYGILDRALGKHFGSDKVERVNLARDGGRSGRAAALYSALLAAKDSDIVVVRYATDGNPGDNDTQDVLAILEAIEADDSVPRPRKAAESLPTALLFAGKLVLEDERMPTGSGLAAVLERNPGVLILDSISDMIHRYTWIDEEVRMLVSKHTGLTELSAGKWYGFVAGLFRFLDRMPIQGTKRGGFHVADDQLLQLLKAEDENSGADSSDIRKQLKRLRRAIMQDAEDKQDEWSKRLNDTTLPVVSK